MNGFLIVDKPAGVTSFSMVSLVRRLTGVRRVGHAGTLDPLASGVLPVAVGQATRFIEYLDDALKAYDAQVRFGEATDTYDAAGTVVAAGDASGVTAAAIERELAGFVGEIVQTPPMFSAIKVAGKPLYRYAREGADVAVAARTVHVESAVLRSYAERHRRDRGAVREGDVHPVDRARPGAAARVRRAPQRAAAHEQRRVRHRRGLPPEVLTSLAGEGRLEEALLAPDRAVERRPAAIFAGDHGGDVVSGRDVWFETSKAAEVCRAYSVEGEFLGVLRHQGEGRWHPEKVIGAG